MEAGVDDGIGFDPIEMPVGEAIVTSGRGDQGRVREFWLRTLRSEQMGEVNTVIMQRIAAWTIRRRGGVEEISE